MIEQYFGPLCGRIVEENQDFSSKHNIPVHFRLSNTLRPKLVHPKDNTHKHKLNSIVYAVQSGILGPLNRTNQTTTLQMYNTT